jgi:hypothetical protein
LPGTRLLMNTVIEQIRSAPITVIQLAANVTDRASGQPTHLLQ